MKSYLYVLFILSVVSISYGYTYCQAPLPVPSTETNGKKLQLVQAISRHGDRTPTLALPFVPGDNAVWNCELTQLNKPNNSTVLNINPSPSRLYRKQYLENQEILPGNCMLGQLTEKGLQQTQLLGEALRAMYIDKYNFLPSDWNSTLFYLRSTDVPRTVASAEGQLSMLYPESETNEAGTQIFDINTIDQQIDYLFINTDICPALTARYAELAQTAAWVSYHNQLQPLIQQLQTLFNTTNLPNFQGLTDVLNARVCHSLPFPPGLTNDMYNEIVMAANWELNYIWTDPIAAQLGMGRFTQDIVDNIDNKINGSSGYSYMLYSAHDTTVGPLMANLGAYDGLWPPYASNIQIELWSDDVPNPTAINYYVQVKYNGDIVTIPGCSSEMCNYETQWRPFVITRTAKPNQCQQSSFMFGWNRYHKY